MSSATAQLGDVGEFIRGITFKPNDVVPLGTPGSVACLRTKNVQTELDLSDVWALPKEFVKSDDRLVRKGDIIISTANSWNLVGKASWVPELDWETTAGGFVSLLRADPTKVYPRYLYHWIVSDHTQANLRKCSRQTTNISNLSLPQARELVLPLPPLDQQKRIAAILDQADALRRLRQRAIDRLNTLGQAIFHEMFGDNAKAQRVPLGDVIEVRSSLADPKLPENRDLPHVGPEHISSGSRRISWERVVSCQEDGVTSGKYVFEEGDVIYSKIRPYLDKVAIADRTGMCSADMYALNCKTKNSLPSFIHFALGTSDFLSYAARSSGRANIPKINRKQLLAYPIPLPTLDAQREFENKIQILEDFRMIAERHARRTGSLFASLQSSAFRGEL